MDHFVATTPRCDMESKTLDAESDSVAASRVPVFLLKTKSTPSDSYEEILTTSKPHSRSLGRPFDPHFVPVLLHRFDDGGMQRIASLLQANDIGSKPGCTYGGMIFTSQRAVEAFASVVGDKKGRDAAFSSSLHSVPIYSVGPATTRALKAIPLDSGLQIFGEHTGNGEALATYIREHYGHWYHDRQVRPPLLFLVGEQRRDVIPKSLMDTALPQNERIRVDEEVVYGTGVMESFADDFEALLSASRDEPERWVVVFSPTGCDSMLRALGLLGKDSDRVDLDRRDGKTFIATIGPTTRTHLVDCFGLEPDVCANSPSPEGILQGIVEFTQRRT